MKRSKVLKIVIWSLVIIAVLAYSIPLGMKFWVIPQIVRSQFADKVEPVWKGSFEIEAVHFSYFKPTYITGISFSDTQGRTPLSIGTLKVSLSQWYKLKPAVSKLEIADLELEVRFDDNRIKLPDELKLEETNDEPAVNSLKTITVNNATITVINQNQRKLSYSNFSLTVDRKPEKTQIILSRITSDSSDSLHVNASLSGEQSKTINADIRFNHYLDRAESLAWSGFFVGKPIYSTDGAISADLVVNLPVDNYRRLLADGNIEFHDFALQHESKPLIDSFDTTLAIHGQDLELEEFRCQLAEGTFSGTVKAEYENFIPVAFSGRFEGLGIKIEPIYQAFPQMKKLRHGSMDFDLQFNRPQPDPNSTTGNGDIFLDNADLSTLPVIPAVFSAIQLGAIEPLKMSDAAVVYDVNGTDLVIKDAIMTNKLSAIKAEPGGKYNYIDKTVDMHIIVLPVKQVDASLNKVPIVNLFVQLKDTLSRFRIKGKVTDPPASLVKKEAVTDITKGSFDFVTDSAKAGIDLPGNIINFITSPFQSNEKENPVDRAGPE